MCYPHISTYSAIVANSVFNVGFKGDSIGSDGFYQLAAGRAGGMNQNYSITVPLKLVAPGFGNGIRSHICKGPTLYNQHLPKIAIT